MNLEKITKQLGVLPTSLDVVCRLMLMLRNPVQKNYDVVNVLLSDKVLSDQLVRKIQGQNTEGQEGENDRPPPSAAELHEMLEQVVLQMGYSAILRLVSALSIGKILTAEQPGYGMARRELWTHSVVVGLLSQRLADVLAETSHARIDPTIAFIAGLMHDVGKAALSPDLAEKKDEVRGRLTAKSATWLELEKETFAGNHAEVGAALLEQWKLPAEISDAVRQHHEPSSENRLAALVHIADYGARFLGASAGWSNCNITVNESAFRILDLEVANFQHATIHLSNQRDVLKIFLNT